MTSSRRAWLRGPHLQSILPSLPLRRVLVERRARPLLSRQSRAAARLRRRRAPAGLLLAGAGSAADGTPRAHTRRAAARLGRQRTLARTCCRSRRRCSDLGCDIVRLNLRDHGDTHHL
jgi:hypothetical protein